MECWGRGGSRSKAAVEYHWVACFGDMLGEIAWGRQTLGGRVTGNCYLKGGGTYCEGSISIAWEISDREF